MDAFQRRAAETCAEAAEPLHVQLEIELVLFPAIDPAVLFDQIVERKRPLLEVIRCFFGGEFVETMSHVLLYELAPPPASCVLK
jgi:hypothetical protein